MKTATEWPLASRRHTAGNRLVDIRIPGRFASRRCPDSALGGLGDRKSSVNSSRRRSMSFFLNPSKLDDSGMGITEYSPEFGLGSKSWKAVQLRECPFGFHVDPHCTTFPMPLAVSSHLAPDDYDSQPRKFTHRKTGRGPFWLSFRRKRESRGCILDPCFRGGDENYYGKQKSHDTQTGNPLTTKRRETTRKG